MKFDSIRIRGDNCFKSDWVDFGNIKPVNVIIGRNNVGKSRLIKMVEVLCSKEPNKKGFKYQCEGTLDEVSLRSQFLGGTSGSTLQGNHWNNHGRLLQGEKLIWEYNTGGNPTILNSESFVSPFGENSTTQRLNRLSVIASTAEFILKGKVFRRLYADRDIQPENASNDLILRPDGTGATNIIRRYIVSATLERALIQQSLLHALNTIFAGDGKFTEIQVQEHDEKNPDLNGMWEIYLGEENKGLIALGDSGSGLKTVILVLLNLQVIPKIEKKSKESYVFAFEELENNLHPALLRRLLMYLEDYAKKEKAVIFLTTHSSVALDFFGVSESAQIIHVTHDGTSAKALSVSAHFDLLRVISELGAKPSDLLQANGIIWVEGPSDCVYIKKWIDVFSESSLKEGRDYQCAFYGGALLARTQFASPEEAEKELINLFRINSNIIVVCDSDKSNSRAQIKKRVQRIKNEVEQIPNSVVWVTGTREIENYLLGSVISSALGLQTLRDPEQYELFFPRKGGNEGSSYVEAQMKRKTVDKMDLAIRSVTHITKEAFEDRFDLASQMNTIISTIKRWNF